MNKLCLASACAAALLAASAPALAARAPLEPPAGTPMAVSHLNPNTATAAQLRAVPGLDAALIAEIVKARPYKTQGDFHKVVSAKVAAAQLPAVYAAVFVPINLNTASTEDMMLIPGMSPRMTREFAEYRPYADIEQFNREIGKYVTPQEVARLRSYVTLN